MMSTRITAVAIAASASLLAACAVGPKYVRPQVPVPQAYKESAQGGGDLLQPARPSDQVSRQGWWDLFGDARLNELEARLMHGNPTLAQAEARVREARAVLREDRAGYFPFVTGSASAVRSHGNVSSRATA